jgi:hypothetical protein
MTFPASLTFFSSSFDEQITSLSNESSERLYHYSQNTTHQSWRKAAIIVLLSRHQSQEDILAHYPCLQDDSIASFKTDHAFMEKLIPAVVSSMNSVWSTPTHQVAVSLFLSSFNTQPDNTFPDQHLTYFSQLYAQFSYYDNNNWTFCEEQCPMTSRFISTLPQSQINRIVETHIAQFNTIHAEGILVLPNHSNQLKHEQQIKSILHDFFILAPRMKPDHTALVLPLLINRLLFKKKNHDELRLLKTFNSQLTNEQRQQVIQQVLDQWRTQTWGRPYLMSHLMAFASETTADDAHMICQALLLELNKSFSLAWEDYIVKSIGVFFNKLENEQIIQLINETDLFLNPQEPLLKHMAPLLTADHAYHLWNTHINKGHKDDHVAMFALLAPQLTQNNVQLIIDAYQTSLTVTNNHTPQDSILNNNTVLGFLTVINTHWPETRETLSTQLFETILSVLNNRLEPTTNPLYDSALKAIPCLIPKLQPEQIEITIERLLTLLNNRLASSIHPLILTTLSALVPKVTKESLIKRLFEDGLFMFKNNPSYPQVKKALVLLQELLPKLDDDQIEMVYHRILFFIQHEQTALQRVATTNRFISVLNQQLIIINDLLPRLTLTDDQAHQLIKHIETLYQTCDTMTRFKTLAALASQTRLTHSSTCALFNEILDELRHNRHDVTSSLCCMALQFTPQFTPDDEEGITTTFDNLIRTMSTYPNYYDDTSSLSMLFSTLCSSLINQMQPEQRLTYYKPNHNNRTQNLLIFKTLSSHCDDAQIALTVDTILFDLKESINDETSYDDTIQTNQLALTVLATLAPRLTTEQAKQVCTTVIETCNQHHIDKNVMVIQSLLINNKLESETLREAMTQEAGRREDSQDIIMYSCLAKMMLINDLLMLTRQSLLNVTDLTIEGQLRP